MSQIKILEEFYTIFGPELKSVTGDPKRIDDVVKRVDSLVKPFDEILFDPFLLKNTLQWKGLMDNFNSVRLFLV